MSGWLWGAKLKAPLFTAAQDGDVATVRTLLAEGGVDVNVKDEKNSTPLYVSSKTGHHDVVKTLLGAGAVVNIATSDINATPLYVASQEGHHEIVKSLLEAGADMSIETSDTNAIPFYVKIVQSVLAAGAVLDFKTTSDGWSPLMVASNNKHLDVVKTLIEKRANVNQTTKMNLTPLYIASYIGDHDVVQTLLGAGADVNRAANGDWSPLMAASYNGHIEVVKTLIEEGADVNHITKDRRMVLDLAVEKGHKEIVEVLKDAQRKMSQQLHDLRQQNKQTEQQLCEMRQQKEQTEQQLHDMRQQMEAYEQQAQRAEERARRAEQDLWLSRQQAQAQLSNPIVQLKNQNIPDYLNSSWHVERNEIQVIEEKPLGEGGWGEVRVAMFRGVKVAAKFIHEAIISPHNIGLFIREMNIAACVRHPNLLLFIGASLDDKSKPVIITELMEANLRSIIKEQKLSRDHAISIGTDVACGLNYLHLMRPDPIIHRDVSSANVLLQKIESINWRAKVSDYGSANFVSEVKTPGPGNASYAAPESSNPKLQSPKMDVYSYGTLLLEMATGQFPDYKQQAAQLKNLQWQEMAALVRRCICEDPASRIDMKDILTSLAQLKK